MDIENMLKNAWLYSLLLLALSACALEPTPTTVPTLDATVLHETAAYQTTQDYLATQSQLPTSTLTPVPTATIIPTLDRTRPSYQSPTPELPCNKAAAGLPFDITIPDGTRMTPGQDFSKTWRLANVGSCTWTRQYAVIFFSGNSLDAYQTHPLLAEVLPGQMIDITIDMQAPEQEGIYQSNWILVDPQGELFGIGPNGDAPFWARIEVVSLLTATPTASPTPTSTPVVYLSGEEDLMNGNTLDLDSAALNPDDVTLADLQFDYGGAPLYVLSTLNNAEWVVYGEEVPSYEDCVAADTSGEGIAFEDVPVGTYLCYQTSEMLPGRLLIEGFDQGQLSISFLTWSVP
jgi:hypothetical protein